MPATGRRRTRKEVNPEPSEVDNADAMQTPTRKRKRVTGDTSTRKSTRTTRTERAASGESDGTVAQEPASDDEASWTRQLDYANKFIKSLRIANYPITAATIHSNEKLNMERQDAYARVSGRDWTFFVRTTSFNIGRPVKAAKPETGLHTSPTAAARSIKAGDDFVVDIDLGPDQQVSRIHAMVEFRPAEEQWAILVNGRNGLLVDEKRYEKGETTWLHSGAVISILGTQMMFTLPAQPFLVHPSIKAQASEDGLSEEETFGNNDASGTGPPGNTSAPHQNGTHQARGGTTAPQQGRSENQFAMAPSLPGTPLTVRSRDLPQPKNKMSPAYGRGIMLESTEDIDYSLDSSQDIKPPHSYAQLIGQAILSSSEEKLTLANIYDFIKEHYAFYRFSGGGWQNSIRHNLSLSKSFEKVARRTDEPGKGMKWQIVPEQRDEFVKKNMTNPRKGLLRVGSSGPASPANGVPSQATERLQGVMYTKNAYRLPGSQRSPRDTTPPTNDFRAGDAFTPERNASRETVPALVHGGSSHTPLYSRSRGQFQTGADRAAGGSAYTSGGSSRTTALTDLATGSPTRPSHSANITTASAGGLYGDYPNAGMALQTPLTRYKPHLAPPSTAHVPSQHMLFSSPAPFWKYANLGSTPARPLDATESPAKPMLEQYKREDTDDGDDHAATDDAEEEHTPEPASAAPADTEQESHVDVASTVQPSSPPLVQMVKPTLSLEGLDAASGDDDDEISPHDASPSRTISRPASRQRPSVPASSGQYTAPMPKLNLGNAPVLAAPASNGANHVKPALLPHVAAASQRNNSMLMGEDGGIDLARGFQRIGSYHRSLSQTNVLGFAPHPAGSLMTPRG